MIQANTISKTFSRETSVKIDINASAKKIWSILTNINEYTRWNSTIVSIEGEVRLGGSIRLVSTLDPKRTFKLKIKAFEPNKLLVWGDPMGKRTYSLMEGSGVTQFSMTEKIGGPIFPLFASQIPSFDESFEQFANDLKKEAEK